MSPFLVDLVVGLIVAAIVVALVVIAADVVAQRRAASRRAADWFAAQRCNAVDILRDFQSEYADGMPGWLAFRIEQFTKFDHGSFTEARALMAHAAIIARPGSGLAGRIDDWLMRAVTCARSSR